MRLSRVDTGHSARVPVPGPAPRPVRWKGMACAPSTVITGRGVSTVSLGVDHPRYQEIPVFGTARATMSAVSSGGIPARRGPV